MKLKMKLFYLPKEKSVYLTEGILVSQHQWCALIPTIVVFGYGGNREFGKMAAIQFEWLYWSLLIQL